MLAESPFRGLPVQEDAFAGVPLPADSPPSGGHYLVHQGAGCVQCSASRPDLAVKHGDPFCSTRCARKFYGCPLDPKTERPARRNRA